MSDNENLYTRFILPAKGAWKAGNLQAAEGLFREAAHQRGGSGLAAYEYGLFLEDQGRPEDALEMFETAAWLFADSKMANRAEQAIRRVKEGPKQKRNKEPETPRPEAAKVPDEVLTSLVIVVSSPEMCEPSGDNAAPLFPSSRLADLVEDAQEEQATVMVASPRYGLVDPGDLPLDQEISIKSFSGEERGYWAGYVLALLKSVGLTDLNEIRILGDPDGEEVLRSALGTSNVTRRRSAGKETQAQPTNNQPERPPMRPRQPPLGIEGLEDDEEGREELLEML